jgi:hypothetical protein
MRIIEHKTITVTTHKGAVTFHFRDGDRGDSAIVVTIARSQSIERTIIMTLDEADWLLEQMIALKKCLNPVSS